MEIIKLVMMLCILLSIWGVIQAMENKEFNCNVITPASAYEEKLKGVFNKVKIDREQFMSLSEIRGLK